MKLILLCSLLFDRVVFGIRPEDCVREEVLALSSEFASDLLVKRQMLRLQTELVNLEEAVDALREKHDGFIADYVSLRQKKASVEQFLLTGCFAVNEAAKKVILPVPIDELWDIEARFGSVYLDFFSTNLAPQTSLSQFEMQGCALHWSLQRDFPSWKDSWFGIAGTNALARHIEPKFEANNHQLLTVTAEIQDREIDIAGLENCVALIKQKFPSLFR